MMNRKDFLAALGVLPLAGTAMKLKDLNKITAPAGNTSTMPLLFLGHGNPMYAIQDNLFTAGWKKVAASLPRPTAILCVSAHWETKGTKVTAMEKPQTIHDFGGFPKELFAVQYHAPGSPGTAQQIQQLITKATVELDHSWGLDHGAWSVIKHLYPAADIPVLQLSLDYRLTPQQHYELAQELNALRKKGVLIVGSGNIVHNLGLVDWQSTKNADWAVTANEKIKDLILRNEHKPLTNYTSLGREVQMGIPSPEHYLPLLYVLGLKQEKERVTFFNDQLDLGSLSMTSVMIS